MKRIPLTQGKWALVDDEDFERLSKHKWRVATGDYVSRHMPGTGNGKTYKTIFMHREIMNAGKGQTVDHINKDPLDNRRSNLRLCSHRQNCWNRTQKHSKSGYIGVYWFPRDQVWYARIRGANSKMLHLGAYETAEDAAYAYNMAAVQLRGEFAVLNEFA